MSDQASKPNGNTPDALRRKLVKSGLATPVVLATLASQPVLGASTHNCTISGQLSGNVSTHLQGNCAELGQTPAYYASLPPVSWPNAASDFLNANGNPRAFRLTPYTYVLAKRFANAYEKEKMSGAGTPIGTISEASVWDVLAGFVVTSTGVQNINWTLRAKAGYVGDLELGREAVAAYMNAAHPTKGYPAYPISRDQVVAMFNAVVVNGGTYSVMSGIPPWNATNVLNYFRSFHA